MFLSYLRIKPLLGSHKKQAQTKYQLDNRYKEIDEFLKGAHSLKTMVHNINKKRKKQLKKKKSK